MNKILNRIILIVALAITACATDPSRYGKVRQYNSADKKAFVFSVDEQFERDNHSSKKDKNFSLMTEAEVKLLKALLKKNDYCVDSGDASFKITSRQEKIYDMTFAHLIEQSYNARPVAPRMYFGECVAR
jgi:hypothetical protein